MSNNKKRVYNKMSQKETEQKRFPSPTNSPFKPRQFKTNKGNKQRFKNNRNNYNKERFAGESEALKGKVYFIGSIKQADNYNLTTEAVLLHIQ